jgi:hypothetical protein
VLHLLMHNLRERQMEYAQAILPVLHAAKRDGWHHVVTGDESWFSSIYDHVARGLCREITSSQSLDLI